MVLVLYRYYALNVHRQFMSVIASNVIMAVIIDDNNSSCYCWCINIYVYGVYLNQVQFLEIRTWNTTVGIIL